MEYFNYILIFSIFTVVLYKQNNNGVFFYIFVFLTSLLVGLRGNEDEYSKLYHLIPSLDLIVLSDINRYKEPIFTLVVSLFKFLSLGPQSIFIFFSSVSVILHGIFFRKYTPYYYLAFLIYLSHDIAMKEMSGLRLGYVSMLVLAMIYFAFNKKRLNFYIRYIISIGIHYISVVSIVILFLNGKFRSKYLFLGLLASILAYYSNLVSFIINYLNSIRFFPESVGSYLGSQYHSYDAGITHSKTLQQIITLLTFIFLYDKHGESVRARAPYFDIIFNTYYVGTILMILLSNFAIFSFRIATNFASVEAILLTYFMFLFRDKKLILFTLITVSLIAAYANYVVYSRLSDYIFLL